MMEPEHWVEGGNLHDTHVSKTKNVVKSIMQRLNVANVPAIGFSTPLVPWLEDGKQLVEHVAIVRLLGSNASVHILIAARSILSKAIQREADCCVPVLELKFALCTVSKPQLNGEAHSNSSKSQERHLPEQRSRRTSRDGTHIDTGDSGFLPQYHLEK